MRLIEFSVSFCTSIIVAYFSFILLKIVDFYVHKNKKKLLKSKNIIYIYYLYTYTWFNNLISQWLLKNKEWSNY